MNQHLFSVTGDKVASVIVDEEAIKLSSSNCKSYQEFLQAWNKKLSLANKHKIELDKIKSISKEENSNEVVISYTSWWGIFTFSRTWHTTFSFKNAEEMEIFLNHFKQRHSFYQITENQTPFQAIKENLVWLLFIIGFTYLGYTTSLDIQQGDTPNSHSGKTRLFYLIIDIVGMNGVIGIGMLACGFVLFKIWKRYKNPPPKTILIASNRA